MTSDTYLASILARIIPEIVLLRTRVALLEGKSPQGAADDVDELLISLTEIEPPLMSQELRQDTLRAIAEGHGLHPLDPNDDPLTS